jgi:hypothetical protein
VSNGLGIGGFDVDELPDYHDMDNGILNYKSTNNNFGIESALKLGNSSSNLGAPSDMEETASQGILRKSALRGFNAVGIESSRRTIEATTNNSNSGLNGDQSANRISLEIMSKS